MPGCGAGRLAYMLARSGFDVEASDCRCVIKLVVKRERERERERDCCYMRSLGAASTSRPLIVGVCSKASSKERECVCDNVETSDCRCVYETLSY